MRNDSILDSVKKAIGYPIEYSDFDQNLLMFINTEFSVLHQYGVGPSDPFIVTGQTETWGDFIGDDDRLNLIESIVFIRAKLMFDPPGSSFVLDNYKEVLKELEWRANIISETIE